MMCDFLRKHKKSFVLFFMGVISAVVAVFFVKNKMACPDHHDDDAYEMYDDMDFEEVRVEE